MTKKIKGLSLVLFLVMMASVFAACGGSAKAPADGRDSAKSTEKASGQSTASALAQKVEITYMNWGNKDEQVQTQKTLDAFNASQQGITAKQIPVPYDQYVTKLNTLAASNSLPDTAIMMESQVLKWAENKMLLDVSGMFSGDAAPLDSLAFKTPDGKVVAYSAANEVLVLYYSKPMFDKAGVAYPPAKAEEAWTWDQFVGTAKKLTRDKNGKTPNDAGFDPKNIVTYGCNVPTATWEWNVFALSNGGGIVNADGTKLLFNSPETIEAAQAIADLNLVHHVAPSPAALKTFPTLDTTLLSGQVAMAVSGQWEIGTSLGNSLDKGLKYGVGVLPKFKQAVTLNTGGPNIIFSSTKYPEQAKEFMRFFYKEENNMGLIQSGVWMPVSKAWYTDEAKIKTWTDNKNHPDIAEYKPAVIDYAMNNALQVPWYYCLPYARMEEVVTSGMDPVWAGTKTAKEAIEKDIMPKLQPIFDSGKAN